jgi:hypothetical protein
MKVVATHQQKSEPGKYSAMESSIAEYEGHGSSTTGLIQDNEVLANHLVKRTESTGSFGAGFCALYKEHGS